MEHIWNLVKIAVKNKVDAENYSIWIEPLKYKEISAKRMVLSAPTTYLAEHVLEHYGQLLNTHLHLIDDSGFTIAFEGLNPAETTFETTPEPQNNQDIANINADYTFENLVVGNCNRFAHAASLAVTESLGVRQYNPLFIYGSTGLGQHICCMRSPTVCEKSIQK